MKQIEKISHKNCIGQIQRGVMYMGVMYMGLRGPVTPARLERISDEMSPLCSVIVTVCGGYAEYDYVTDYYTARNQV